MERKLAGLRPKANQTMPSPEQQLALRSMVKSLSPSSSSAAMMQVLSPKRLDQTKKSSLSKKKGSATFDTNTLPQQAQASFKKRSQSIPANANKSKPEEAKIRQSFEEKGYSMQLQSTRTKAVADTLDIIEPRVRSETVRKVNTLGKHLVSDLKIPRWTENDNQVLKYI